MRSIEGARGIAALMVLLMHAANLMAVDHFSGHIGLNGMFSFGYIGVDFFFVLSGFIITFVHFDDIGKREQTGSYLRKRLFRIFPIYWFCLALTIAILLAGRLFLGKDPSLGISNTDIFGTLLLLPLSEPKFVEVAWSLQYEIMFYGLFSFLVINRRLGSALFSLWFLAILCRLVFAPGSPSYGGLLNAYSLQFLFGVITGLTTRKKNFTWVSIPFLAFGVSCFAAAAYYERAVASAPHGPFGQILLGIGASLILFSLVELEKQTRIHTPRWLYQLGAVSYSVYLSHIVFLNLVYSMLLKAGLYHRLPEAVVFLSAVGVTIVCATAIGRFVELPLGRFFKRRLSPAYAGPIQHGKTAT